jgi:hypothetical protein
MTADNRNITGEFYFSIDSTIKLQDQTSRVRTHGLSQKMTVAAMQMADMKACAQRS